MKPILVTGGAQGLGAVLCLELAARGHDVVVHYHTSEAAAQSVAQACQRFSVHAEAIQGDWTSHKTLNDFLARYTSQFPETKGLVNNVGNYLISSAQNTPPDQWLALFQTNFFAPVFLTQALVPALRHCRGSIVNIGVAGLDKRGFIQSAAYGTTKAALLFYTLSLAKELAPDGIRVNMVSPGHMENSVDLPASLPMRRTATLKEVAHIIAAFFDPQTDYITGQNLEVAGAYGL